MRVLGKKRINEIMITGKGKIRNLIFMVQKSHIWVKK